MRGLGWTTCTCLAAALAATACKTTEQAGKEVVEAPRKIIGAIEPTGMVEETEKREAVWESLRRKIDELNVGGFNKAVADLGVVAERVSGHVAALDTATLQTIEQNLLVSSERVRQQIEAAQLADTIASLDRLVKSAEAKVAQVQLDKTANLLEEATSALTRSRETIERLDPAMHEALAQATQALAELSDSVKRLPVDPVTRVATDLEAAAQQIEAATAKLPGTLARVDALVTTAGNTLRVATIAICLVGGWAGIMLIGGLMKLLRPTR